MLRKLSYRAGGQYCGNGRHSRNCKKGKQWRHKQHKARYKSVILSASTSNPGMTTKQLYAWVESNAPELVTDAPCTHRKSNLTQAEWKHDVRRAQATLKVKGLLRSDGKHKGWHLAKPTPEVATIENAGSSQPAA
jgi:hypothetical protein